MEKFYIVLEHSVCCIRGADENMCALSEYYKKYLSRHTVVCRAAKKASTPHHEYIDRKKENNFFMRA